MDVAYDQLNKTGEELCGDHVEIIRTEDGVIVVLSDGLGSGVKAHILATMTTKIAGTMLKEGLSITEVVNTIAATLPICQIREIAYSTFTIIYVYNNGEVYTVEFDNPPLFCYDQKEKKIYKSYGKELEIDGKRIYQNRFQLKEGDFITAVSDGVIHAGLGVIFNIGWTWDNVAQYLKRLYEDRNSVFISKALMNTCRDLYDGKPGDDATAVTIQLKRPEYVNIFTGPPVHKENDPVILKEFIEAPGKKVICGGTAANIAARECKTELKLDLSTLTKEIPPITYMRGFDLVTEGILTMRESLGQLKDFYRLPLTKEIEHRMKEKNGAAMLSRLLIHDCTHVNFYVGRAVNPAHQSLGSTSAIPIKLKVVGEMINILKKLGKVVGVRYY